MFRHFPTLEYPLDQSTVTRYTDITRFVDVRSLFRDDVTPYLSIRVEDGRRPDILSFELYGTVNYWWTFFLVNEHLLDGLSSWPRDSKTQENYVKDKYQGFYIEPFRSVRSADYSHIVNGLKVGDELSQGAVTGEVMGINPELNQIMTDALFENTSPIVTPNGSIPASGDFSIRIGSYILGTNHWVNSNNEQEVPFEFDAIETASWERVNNLAFEDEENEKRSNIRYIQRDYIADFVTEFKRVVRS